MMTTSYVANSCACYAIHSLGSQGNAITAMANFCAKELVVDGGRFTSKDSPQFKTLASFYVFVAGPEVAGKGWSMPWTKYGTEFAQFILDNNLGEITTLGKTINERHHPDTDCQVWLWKPNGENIKKWYVEYKTPKTKATSDNKARTDGNWTIAVGVAGGHYNCPHCGKTYVRGESIYEVYDAETKKLIYYCEKYGKGE